MDEREGGATVSSPGGALAATRRIRVSLSGAMMPLTSPPAQFSFALGSFDQPTATLIPGPSAPVEQSTIWTYPGSPDRLWPGTVRRPTGRRQTPVAWRNSGNCSLASGIVGKAIGGSFSAAAYC